MTFVKRSSINCFILYVYFYPFSMFKVILEITVINLSVEEVQKPSIASAAIILRSVAEEKAVFEFFYQRLLKVGNQGEEVVKNLFRSRVGP